MTRATGRAPSGPPQPSPRRYNDVLRLYDAPLHRDWAFWLTVGIAVLTALSIGTSQEQTSGLPRWLDTLLATLTFALLFGVVPAWIRLGTRRWRWRERPSPPKPPPDTTSPPIPASRPTPSPHATPPPRTTATPLATPAPRPAPAPRTDPSPPRPAPPRRTPPPPPHGPARPESAYPPSPDPLAAARRAFPHPVARTVHEMQRAHTAKDRHEALLEAGETLAATVAVTAAGLLTAHGAGERNLAELRTALAGTGTTFGTWTVWLHHLCKVARERTDVVPGLAEALRDDSQMAARPDDPGLAQFLDRLKGERNRTSHGDKPRTQEEAALRVTEHQLTLEQALISAQFLTGLPWLLTVSCAYQRRTGTFEVVADHLMGDHPDFDRLTFSCPAPVADDTVYVLSPAGPVALSPFVASLYCAQCGRREICHANNAGRRNRPAAYKSFGRGHVIPYPELDEEIAALPGPRPSPRPSPRPGRRDP
ncbi:hypothetical protein [Streptomyces monomycini]|uniref:hypothetical protein n=3 Tax=Streptomyces monomycini TaxID=371720 RepID=UPI001EEB4ADD|nr:hypothetical protein [Streptomyces monomycini]